MRKNCLVCGREIVKSSHLSINDWDNRKKYCSNKCKYIALHKGNRSRRTGEYRNCLTCGKKFYVIKSLLKKKNKGLYCSQECMWGSPGRNKKISGENHYLWKGENVSYRGLHNWVRKGLGKPKRCEFCGSTKRLEWANKDHQYRRNLVDWMALCKSCHFKYDIKNKLRIDNLNFNK
jgi:hypothetical protein